jgi:hypothetical protein
VMGVATITNASKTVMEMNMRRGLADHAAFSTGSPLASPVITVTPAKAGVQLPFRGWPGQWSGRGSWIPAFAGMTEGAGSYGE